MRALILSGPQALLGAIERSAFLTAASDTCNLGNTSKSYVGVGGSAVTSGFVNLAANVSFSRDARLRSSDM